MSSEFLQDVVEGLSQTQKTLPCKYFYDERGSQLFTEICEQEEYYLTNTEIELLKNNAQDIAKIIGKARTLSNLVPAQAKRFKLCCVR